MTKKAKVLASSVAAIALSSSLIAGSTFALFTSESSVNIAVSSAKVKVAAAVDKTSVKVSSTLGTSYVQTSFDENDNLVLNNIAAGDSVSVKINITNYSTISVLYKAKVAVTDIADGGLSEVLEVNAVSDKGVSYDGLWRTLSAATDENGDNLDSVTVTISLPEEVTDHMAESCKVAFNIEAVQGNAPVTNRAVSSEKELADALKVGGTVVLEEDIEFASALKGAYITEDTVLDLNNHDFHGDIRLDEPVTLTINGNGSVGAPYAEGFSSQNVFVANKDAKVIINGGNYVSPGGSAVYANPGQVEINGGTFGFSTEFLADAAALYNAYKADGNFDNAVTTDNAWIEPMKAQIADGRYDAYYKNPDKFLSTVINGNNAPLKDGTAKITISGGTFVNYNPEWGDDNVKTENGKFLADGYGVVSSVDENGDTWYKVVEAYKEVERDFTDAEETKQLFCPDCFNHPGSDHSEHTMLGDSVIVDEERGVLQVVSESAFTTFDADWADYKYTLSNNVDLSNLKDGEFIIFSSGLTNPYLNDLLVAIKKVDGKLYVRSAAGDFTPNDNDYVLSSDDIECVWSYETDENGKLIASAVIDGYTVKSTNNVFNVKAQHKIQWQVYLTPAANKGTGNALAEISNFKLVAELK